MAGGGQIAEKEELKEEGIQTEQFQEKGEE